ncbi:MAG: rRNA maturation RNase YbeY [Bacillota bacterium]
MSISISNQQDKIPFTRELEETILKVTEIVFAREAIPPNLELAIVLSDDREIRKLNREYRDIDSPTDVLSFAYRLDSPWEPGYDDLFPEEEALGDIVISLERAKVQGEEFGHSLARELGFLVVHGLYHLLGYEHQDPEGEKLMRAKEEEILSLVGLGR